MMREGILKHKNVFDQWLGGADVEYYLSPYSGWLPVDEPSWDVNTEYRVKSVPRTFYINVHPDGAHYSHSTYESAVQCCTIGGVQKAEIVKVVEVLGG